MSGANSFKFVLLPPQSDITRDWAKRLAEIVPEARVILAEDADTTGTLAELGTTTARPAEANGVSSCSGSCTRVTGGCF